MKQRLDQKLVELKLVPTRSQAESYIRLGQVKVNGKVVTKTGTPVGEKDNVLLTATEQYVSRAALKLASVAKILKVDFNGKTILDVGSSTGGFTDYALRHGAVKSIAVEVGKDQLHPSLHGDPRIELHEQTDIRDCYLLGSEEGKRAVRESGSAASRHDDGDPGERGFSLGRGEKNRKVCLISEAVDVVVADVSFISLREILPSVAKLCSAETQIVAMAKPQFEAAASNMKHKGVIKNDRMRRDILKDFETWVLRHFVIIDKADSEVSGSKGNVERFYLLKKLKATK